MNIIDRNGKVFGKVNVLDMIVLLIVLVPLLFIAINKFFPDKKVVQIKQMPKQMDCQLEILLDKQRSWLVTYIQKGDGQKDLENNYMAQIIDIKQKKVSNAAAVVVVIQVKANMENNGFLMYGSNILRMGQDFVLETKQYLLKGIVYKVEFDGKV